MEIGMTLKSRVSAAALLAFGLLAGNAAVAGDCTAEAFQALVPSDTTITQAARTSTPVAHCKVEGYVTTQNPGPNQVNFRLQLPDENWNGRYYFIGMGGSAGFLPSTSQFPPGSPLFKGFAVAGTDTGHQMGMLNWSFLGKDEAKAEDHIHRGAHVTAVVTQEMTRKYYGTDKMYRYHTGCSGGGRMGMEAITRHPEDFDGVLLGAPGGRSSATMLSFIHASQQMHREPGAWLSYDKLKMAEDKVTQKCDALDGATDGIIWDRAVCSFDFSTLQCAAADAPDCLTKPEIKSINAILAGPKGPNGPIKAGFPISNMSSWATFLGAPPPWPENVTMANIMQGSAGYTIASTLAQSFFGEDYNALEDFDFNDQADVDAWWAAAERIGYGKPYTANLKGMQKAGGKILFWNGVSDACCLDSELEQYTKEAADSVGGAKKFAKFSVLYKVPGVEHCSGGTGPNDAPDQLLQALIDWVEKDQTPANVVAHRGSLVEHVFADPATGVVTSDLGAPQTTGSDRDFVLCPHPQVAKFNGKKGGEAYANNWSCK